MSIKMKRLKRFNLILVWNVDIVDWKELIDETVEDVVIVDGINFVGSKVELEIGLGEEYIACLCLY